MAIEANSQPSMIVEGAGRIQHATHHGSKGRANLLGRNAIRQLPTQGHFGKKVKGAETITE